MRVSFYIKQSYLTVSCISDSYGFKVTLKWILKFVTWPGNKVITVSDQRQCRVERSG